MGENLKLSFGKKQGHFDLSKNIDTTILRVVPETPANSLHAMFRSLGIKLVVVTNHDGQLVGLVTKKSFIHAVEQLHGHDKIARGSKRASVQEPLKQPLLDETAVGS